MDIGVGLQPDMQAAEYTAYPAALWHRCSSAAPLQQSQADLDEAPVGIHPDTGN